MHEDDYIPVPPEIVSSWLDGWRRDMQGFFPPMPLRCTQCQRYLPSDEAVERLLADVPQICDECDRMRGRP